MKIFIHKSKRGLLLETDHLNYKSQIKDLDLSKAKHIRVLLAPEEGEDYPCFKTTDGHDRLHNQTLRTSVPTQWFLKPSDNSWDNSLISDTVEDAINCLFLGKKSKYICLYEKEEANNAEVCT